MRKVLNRKISCGGIHRGVSLTCGIFIAACGHRSQYRVVPGKNKQSLNIKLEGRRGPDSTSTSVFNDLFIASRSFGVDQILMWA